MSDVKVYNPITEFEVQVNGPDDIKAAMSIDNFVSAPAASPEGTPGLMTPPPSSTGGVEHDHGHEDAVTAAGTTDGEGEANGAALTPAPVVREFKCMNDDHSECQTGQYTMDLARKVISNHFGRNKACTRIIKDWPLFCRKHYQRATYKPDLWQRRKIDLILRQFRIIEDEHPGTTYDIALKKAEEVRLNTYSRKVASGIPVEQASAAVAPNTKAKSFQAPIDILRELEGNLGNNKTFDEVNETIAIIFNMFTNGETSEVPSIEFLPNIPKQKGTTSRISAKGGIQKPTNA